MKWVLIMFYLSSWDGHVLSHEEVGYFNSQKDCLSEIVRAGHMQYTRFMCMNSTPNKQPFDGKL